MRIALGNDHGGHLLRTVVMEAVTALGHEVLDFGSASPDPVDYPEVAVQVARAVVSGEAELGILICGTGIGIAIAANKVPGAYAAPCTDCFSARLAREHNAANILCLGGRVSGPGIAAELVRIFLTAQPSAEPRHLRRRLMVEAIRPPHP
jgi:ribose 5-phosphate isomerase B